MTLLEQCRYWIQNNEPQNAVTAIEALPQEERDEALLLLLEQARSALAGADGNVSSSLLGSGRDRHTGIVRRRKQRLFL